MIWKVEEMRCHRGGQSVPVAEARGAEQFRCASMSGIVYHKCTIIRALYITGRVRHVESSFGDCCAGTSLWRVKNGEGGDSLGTTMVCFSVVCFLFVCAREAE